MMHCDTYTVAFTRGDQIVIMVNTADTTAPTNITQTWTLGIRDSVAIGGPIHDYLYTVARSYRPATWRWFHLFADVLDAVLVVVEAERTARQRRPQSRGCARDARRWKRRRFVQALRRSV